MRQVSSVLGQDGERSKLHQANENLGRRWPGGRLVTCFNILNLKPGVRLHQGRFYKMMSYRRFSQELVI